MYHDEAVHLYLFEMKRLLLSFLIMVSGIYSANCVQTYYTNVSVEYRPSRKINLFQVEWANQTIKTTNKNIHKVIKKLFSDLEYLFNVIRLARFCISSYLM